MCVFLYIYVVYLSKLLTLIDWLEIDDIAFDFALSSLCMLLEIDLFRKNDVGYVQAMYYFFTLFQFELFLAELYQYTFKREKNKTFKDLYTRPL